MKKIILSAFFLFLLATAAFAASELLIADFNSGEPPCNIGGDYGTWNHNPNDETQGCYYFAEPEDYKDAKAGYSIRLDYDVQSKNPAFDGFWLKLKDVDVSGYDYLSFWVRGAKDGKFTSKFKIELKDSAGKRAIYPVQEVTGDWKEVKIEFKKTKSVVDWKKMGEFVITFDDIVATYKEGTIFIDQIMFKKQK